MSSIVICCDGTWNSADQAKKKVMVKGKEVEEEGTIGFGRQ